MTYRKVTQQEHDQIVQLYNDGLSIQRICDITGRSRSTVKRHAYTNRRVHSFSEQFNANAVNQFLGAAPSPQLQPSGIGRTFTPRNFDIDALKLDLIESDMSHSEKGEHAYNILYLEYVLNDMESKTKSIIDDIVERMNV